MAVTNKKNKPLPGDVLCVNRGMYKHYGVCVGSDTIVHFSGDKNHEISAKEAYIQKTNFNGFRKGGEIQVESGRGKSFSRDQTVKRALESVGTGKGEYNLVSNNYEHFANWCRYGKKKSRQVEQVAAGTVGIAGIMVAIVGTVFVSKKIKDRC